MGCQWGIWIYGSCDGRVKVKLQSWRQAVPDCLAAWRACMSHVGTLGTPHLSASIAASDCCPKRKAQVTSDPALPIQFELGHLNFFIMIFLPLLPSLKIPTVTSVSLPNKILSHATHSWTKLGQDCRVSTR